MADIDTLITRGLRRRKRLTKRPTNRAQDVRSYAHRNRCAKWTAREEPDIERRDLLTEEDAVVADTAYPGGERDAGRPRSPAREDWDHDHIVAEPITHILRHD